MNSKTPKTDALLETFKVLSKNLQKESDYQFLQLGFMKDCLRKLKETEKELFNIKNEQ